MQRAFENNEFHIFYQPKYNLKRGGMDGSEILVRWFDTKIDRYRTPGEFLPIFEENGFINNLDRFVFYKLGQKGRADLSLLRECIPGHGHPAGFFGVL